MTSVRANGVELGVERFGRDGDPLVLLVGGVTMLSWPDTLCERLASGGCRVAGLADAGRSWSPVIGGRGVAAVDALAAGLFAG